MVAPMLNLPLPSNWCANLFLQYRGRRMRGVTKPLEARLLQLSGIHANAESVVMGCRSGFVN